MSLSKNKNCSELLLTKGMGLDRAPFQFFTLAFLDPHSTVRLQSTVDIAFYVDHSYITVGRYPL